VVRALARRALRFLLLEKLVAIMIRSVPQHRHQKGDKGTGGEGIADYWRAARALSTRASVMRSRPS
jgi:hypothetical protein